MSEHFPRLGYGGPTHWMLLSLYAPPISIVQMILAYCCPCAHLHSYLPTMSHLQHSPRCGGRTHSFPIKFACICGLGLCPFSELVCNLLPRRLFNGSPKAHCQKSVSVTIFWRKLGLLGVFPTPVGGHHSLGATFLATVVREIDCGNWLARGYMPAHQRCLLFYPLAGDLIWSTLNEVVSGPPVRDSFLGPQWLIRCWTST